MPETKQERAGAITVLSGPSAVGKDTVIRRLQQLAPELGLRRPIAYTTREPRPAEVDGRDYSFVGLETFKEMEARGQFLETALVHGNMYGTSRERVERLRSVGGQVLLKIDVQGSARLRELGIPALFIFLAPPSREVLLQRLLERGTESQAELERRIQDADLELAEAHWYDRVVVNDEVDRAALEVARIIAEAQVPASGRPR